MDWRNEKLTLTWKDFVKIADRPECILVLKALISRNIGLIGIQKKYAMLVNFRNFHAVKAWKTCDVTEVPEVGHLATLK